MVSDEYIFTLSNSTASTDDQGGRFDSIFRLGLRPKTEEIKLYCWWFYVGGKQLETDFKELVGELDVNIE